MVTLMQIKQELVVKLRNADLISISDRGISTELDAGVFVSDSTHTLDTTPTLVKNVRNVMFDGDDLVFGTDYTVNYDTGVITFTTPKSGAYIIDYDVGSTDRIFPDFPQPHLKLSDFPRIAVDIIGSTSNEIGVGAAVTQSTYQVSIICYDKDQTDVEDLISSSKQLLMDNKKDFFYSSFITPTTVGPLLVTEFGNRKILQRNQDAEVRFSFDGI